MSPPADALQPAGPGRYAFVAYGLAVLTLVVDQLSKYWVVSVFDLPDKGSVAVLPLLRLTMVWNRGVSYGLLTAHGALGRWLLVAFSLAVVVGLGVWAWRSARLLPALGVGLIMGGAVGNALDRARIGQVMDFVDVTQLHFPWVFNVADSGISVGVALLLLDSLFARRRE